MLQIQINNRDITAPTTWNELTTQQAIGLYSIVMQDSDPGMPAGAVMAAKRIRMMCFLLGLDEAFMLQWQQAREEEHGEDGGLAFYAEVGEICNQLLDGFFDIEEDAEGNRLYSLRFGLTRCPFPSLSRTGKKRQKREYLAPADELGNLSLYELGTSFTLFETYLESKAAADAHQLLAALFRPPKPPTKKNKQRGYQGDRRLPLLHHESMISVRAEHIATLPETVTALLLFWFASCRHKIVEDNPDIFTAPDEAKTGPDFGWGGVLLSLSNGLVHLDEVSNQPYQNGLLYLRWLEDRRKEAEKAMRKVR